MGWMGVLEGTRPACFVMGFYGLSHAIAFYKITNDLNTTSYLCVLVLNIETQGTVLIKIPRKQK